MDKYMYSTEGLERELEILEHLEKRNLATWEDTQRIFEIKRQLALGEFNKS